MGNVVTEQQAVDFLKQQGFDVQAPEDKQQEKLTEKIDLFKRQLEEKGYTISVKQVEEQVNASKE